MAKRETDSVKLERLEAAAVHERGEHALAVESLEAVQGKAENVAAEWQAKVRSAEELVSHHDSVATDAERELREFSEKG
jgi:hypothetical protein